MPEQDHADAGEQEHGGAAGSKVAPPWADGALAAVTTGIGVWVWVEARGFPDADDPARDPAVLPLVLACVLWICALALVVRITVQWLRTPRSATRSSGAPVDLTQLKLVALFVLALVLYIWGAFEFGYLVATWLFLTAATCALGGRPTIRGVALTATVAAVCGVAIWLAFVQGLGVHLPETWAP